MIIKHFAFYGMNFAFLGCQMSKQHYNKD